MNVCTRCGFEVACSCRAPSQRTGRYVCADVAECTRRNKNNLTMFEINWFAEQSLRGLRRVHKARKVVT